MHPEPVRKLGFSHMVKTSRVKNSTIANPLSLSHE